MNTIQHFVNGKKFSGNSERVGKVFNPATGEQSAEVKLATTKDVMMQLRMQVKLLKVGLISLHYKERE